MVIVASSFAIFLHYLMLKNIVSLGSLKVLDNVKSFIQ